MKFQVNHNNKTFMREALEEAKKAYAENEVPVGAVVVYKNRIIAKAYNQKLKSNDFRAHAEVIALNKAQKVIGDWRLNDCDLYVNLEPCVMCAGAILETRIKNVYFGLREVKQGSIVSKLNVLDADLPHKVKYFGGILENESKSLITNFFKKIRKTT
tara:strand:- start:7976 stop:8446 length:471 start_codon:yes stop_codon:yes gene_type:complete